MKRSFVVCLVCVALTFPALGNSARASEPSRSPPPIRSRRGFFTRNPALGVADQSW